MQQLAQVFEYQGKEVRTIQRDSGIWWVLKDVCDILGLTNPTIVASRLDTDEVTKFDLGGLSGESNIVSESGLYNVILRSDKPEAKQFKRWVTHDVLPSIRRHGVYATPAAVEAMLQDPDTMIRTLQALKEERRQKAVLQAQVAQLTPPAQAWQTLAEAKGDYSLRDAAQILSRDPAIDTGQNRLMKYLRQLRWVDRSGTPYQVQIDNGRLAVRTNSYTHPHTGEPILTSQLRVTVKGVTKLHALLGGTSPLQIPGVEEVA